MDSSLCPIAPNESMPRETKVDLLVNMAMTAILLHARWIIHIEYILRGRTLLMDANLFYRFNDDLKKNDVI